MRPSLSFAGYDYPIDSRDFSLGRLSEGSEYVQFSVSLPRPHLFIIISRSLCVGAILGVADDRYATNLAIIGATFLKSCEHFPVYLYSPLEPFLNLRVVTGYTAYDYAGSRVGFAPSINNK